MKNNPILSYLLPLPLVFVSALSIGCQTLRGPNSTTSGNEFKEHLIALQKVAASSNNCEADLKTWQTQLQGYPLEGFSLTDFKTYSKDLIAESWKSRLALYDQLPNYPPACIVTARDIINDLRGREDYFGEFAYNTAAILPEDIDFQKQPIPLKDNQFYQPALVRPGADQSFRNGDVMLARGVSFISAIISKISTNNSHFSHVVTMYKDPKNVDHTLESYVGAGANSFDIDFALKNENARLMVLRFKDEKIAAGAGDYAWNLITTAEKKKHVIGYDYGFDFKDPSKLSCVEIAVQGFRHSSEGKVEVPLVPAHTRITQAKFLGDLNLKTGPMITPGDLETDPRFEVISDWRDYRLTRDSRHKDAVLDEMLRWIQEYDYEFRNTFKSVIAKHVLLPASSTRLWPLFRKLGAPNVDPEIPKKTLGVMAVMNQVAEKILLEVRFADKQFIKKMDRPMTNGELRAFLERFRQLDYEGYIDGTGTSVHDNFRPSHK